MEDNQIRIGTLVEIDQGISKGIRLFVVDGDTAEGLYALGLTPNDTPVTREESKNFHVVYRSERSNA